MKNLLKEKMINDEQTICTFHEMGSEIAIELLAYGGMDYVLIDTEHGPFDVESTARFIRAANLAGTTPLVRIKDGERNSILKMLDVGAMGLIIPNIETVEEVKNIVSNGKYQPIGNRGAAPASGTHYWTKDYATQGLEHYFNHVNNEQLLIPQCETVGCLENIEEIAKIEGVDGIFIGPFDLSTSMGIPGQFDKPEFVEALDRIYKACKDAGKFVFIYGPNVEASKVRFEQGYDSVTMAMDAIIFNNAVKEVVKQLK